VFIVLSNLSIDYGVDVRRCSLREIVHWFEIPILRTHYFRDSHGGPIRLGVFEYHDEVYTSDPDFLHEHAAQNLIQNLMRWHIRLVV
jgi:hypothetical protein